MAQSAYKALYKVLMNINESSCWPYGMVSALIVLFREKALKNFGYNISFIV